MKHAGVNALGRLAPILEYLRGRHELSERRPGVFYRKSRAFLHFHEDPAGLFADIRSFDGIDFDRIPVGDALGFNELIKAVEARLARPSEQGVVGGSRPACDRPPV